MKQLKKPPQSGANTSKIELIRHKRKMKRLRIGAVLVLILTVVLVFCLTNIGSYGLSAISDGFDSAQMAFFKGNGFPVHNTVDEYIDSASISGSIAVLGKKELVIFSPSGAPLSTVQHGYANPKLTASSKKLCVYNQGGTELRIEGRKQEIAIKTFDQPILFAKYAKNSTLAVVTGSSTHKAELTVFTAGGEEIFKFKLVNDYPVGIDFAEDNKTMSLTCVTPDNGQLMSSVYILNTGLEKEKAKTERKNGVPLYTHFLSATRLLVVYDDGAVVYNTKDCAEVANYSFPDKLLAVSRENEQNTGFLFGDEKQPLHNKFVVLDSEFKAIAGKDIPVSASQIFVTRQTVYIFATKEVYAYDFKTQTMQKLSLDGYAVDMLLADVPVYITNTQIDVLPPMVTPTPLPTQK
ncbi:MAG: DUF5711 family protein [Oscillospiraceae bacterium]